MRRQFDRADDIRPYTRPPIMRITGAGHPVGLVTTAHYLWAGRLVSGPYGFSRLRRVRYPSRIREAATASTVFLCCFSRLPPAWRI